VSHDKVETDDKEKLRSSIDELKNIGDTAFTIMTTLQFQDIVRQQLSAIGNILTQTKKRIEKSIKKIEGLQGEDSISDEDYFIPTDPSILEKQESQDNIDSIISGLKDEDNN